MLKISLAERNGRTITLKIEGRIVGPWVEELRHACEPLLKDVRILQLDLADVSFVDADGLAALIDFRRRGTKLLNTSPFVEDLLGNFPPG